MVLDSARLVAQNDGNSQAKVQGKASSLSIKQNAKAEIGSLQETNERDNDNKIQRSQESEHLQARFQNTASYRNMSTGLLKMEQINQPSMIFKEQARINENNESALRLSELEEEQNLSKSNQIQQMNIEIYKKNHMMTNEYQTPTNLLGSQQLALRQKLGGAIEDVGLGIRNISQSRNNVNSSSHPVQSQQIRSYQQRRMETGNGEYINQDGQIQIDDQSRDYNTNNSVANGSSKNDFNLFSHHKLTSTARMQGENYISLKEALLELYLSVKIRSDEEIDAYTEEQFRQEKETMKQVDGFTLIDYIKSSIEILMNMKIEENEGNQKQHFEKDEDQKRDFYGVTIDEDPENQINPEKQKPIHYMNFEDSGKKKKKDKNFPERREKNARLNDQAQRQDAGLKVIPKIDDKTPTSSILDLQKKLDQISSPASNVSMSTVSIPVAHKEYEKALRTLEQECRNHIKVEQQMKLHIECLQEKLDQTVKEKETVESQLQEQDARSLEEVAKLNKIIKTLEEELIAKAEKIKSFEADAKKYQDEEQSLLSRIKELQRQNEKLKKEKERQVASRNIEGLQFSQPNHDKRNDLLSASERADYQDQVIESGQKVSAFKKQGNVLRSHSEFGNYSQQNNNKGLNTSRDSSQAARKTSNPKLSASILEIQRDPSLTERNSKNSNNLQALVGNPYLVDSYNRLQKHIISTNTNTDAVNKSMSYLQHAGSLSGGNGGMLSAGVLTGNQDSTRRSSQMQQSSSDGHKRSKSQSQMSNLAKQVNFVGSKNNQASNQQHTHISFFKGNKANNQANHRSQQQLNQPSFTKVGLKSGIEQRIGQASTQLNTSRNEVAGVGASFISDLNHISKTSIRRNIQQSHSVSFNHPQNAQLGLLNNSSINTSQINYNPQAINTTTGNSNLILINSNNNQGEIIANHQRNWSELQSHHFDIGRRSVDNHKLQQQNQNVNRSFVNHQPKTSQVASNIFNYNHNQSFSLITNQIPVQQQPLDSYRRQSQQQNQQVLLHGNMNPITNFQDINLQLQPQLSQSSQQQSLINAQQLSALQTAQQYSNSFQNLNYQDVNSRQTHHLRTKSSELANVYSGSFTSREQQHFNQNSQEKLSKIYLEKNTQGSHRAQHPSLKKIPKAYLQKVLADSKKPRNSVNENFDLEAGGSSINQNAMISNSNSVINTSFKQLKR